jgi:hypothetical protein
MPQGLVGYVEEATLPEYTQFDVVFPGSQCWAGMPRKRPTSERPEDIVARYEARLKPKRLLPELARLKKEREEKLRNDPEFAAYRRAKTELARRQIQQGIDAFESECRRYEAAKSRMERMITEVQPAGADSDEGRGAADAQATAGGAAAERASQGALPLGLVLRRSTLEIWYKGVRVELKGRTTNPFTFLLKLAESPQQVVSHRQMQDAFGAKATYMDVYQARDTMRRAFGKAGLSDAFGKLVKNKARCGYWLDLPAESVFLN